MVCNNPPSIDELVHKFNDPVSDIVQITTYGPNKENIKVWTPP